MTEIQNTHRGSAQTQGHGLYRRRCAGRGDKGPGWLLDVQAGVPGTGPQSIAKTPQDQSLSFPLE